MTLDKVLRALVEPPDSIPVGEARKWMILAVQVMGLSPEQVTPGNIDEIMNVALGLYKDEIVRRNSRHDYWQESKLLPFDRFSQAVQMLWQGATRNQIENQTGVSHKTVYEFRKWWKKHKDEHDPNNIRAIYHAYLQRNLAR